MVKHSTMHTNQVRKRQHGSSGGQQAAGSSSGIRSILGSDQSRTLQKQYSARVFENIQCNRPNLQIIRPKCR